MICPGKISDIHCKDVLDIHIGIECSESKTKPKPILLNGENLTIFMYS